MFQKTFVHGKQLMIVLIDVLKRVCGKSFFCLRKEVDCEWIFINGSIVKADQHASGARSKEERAIGQSRGGNSTKIHMLTDAHRNPYDFKTLGVKFTTAKLPLS